MIITRNTPKSRDYRDVIVAVKFRFQNVFRPHKKQPVVFKFFRFILKSVFEKPRFGEGLVWSAGLTVGIKLRFQLFSV